MTGFGLDDAAILAGTLMIAWSLWAAWGLPALLGFAGCLLVLAGLTAIVRRSARGG